MFDFMSNLNSLVSNVTDGAVSIRKRKYSEKEVYGSAVTYDESTKKPVLRCSICNGEQVAGFKDIHTGKFEEVTLIRDGKELEEFMNLYGIKEISKEY